MALGVPFVLFLPGYALTSALFARRRIGRADVALLSLAFSASIVVLGTLILNALPWNLTTRAWVCLLLAATLTGALWALHAVPAENSRELWPLPPIARGQVLLVALALAVAAGAVIVARTPLPAKGVLGYTALWILPGPEKSDTIVIGVQSSELHTTSYQLKVRSAGGHEFNRRLTLAPGESWVKRFRVGRSATRVDAELFRDAAPHHLYRRVRLLLHPAASAE